MDLKEIQNLIKFVAKSGASEVSLETEDFKINIKTGSEGETQVIHQVAAPVVQAAPAPVAAAPARGDRRLEPALEVGRARGDAMTVDQGRDEPPGNATGNAQLVLAGQIHGGDQFALAMAF